MTIIFDQKTISLIVSQNIIPLLKNKRIFALYGPMGSGKTTLVKEFLRQCGITQTVVSPTFGYVNTYHDNHGRVFYHFDLYRLSSLNEFISAGFDELLSTQDSFHLIEWPELIKPLLTSSQYQPDVQIITLSYLPKKLSQRALTLEE